MTKKNNYDLIIMGGGPSGIWAAYYAAYRGLKVALVELNKFLGGMPFYIYPTKPIYDIPALTNINGIGFIDLMIKQMNTRKNKIDIYTDTTPASITKEKLFHVCLKNKSEITAKCLLFSQGNGIAIPKKLSDVPIVNAKIKYTIRNLAELANKDVLISGGGDSALDYALALSSLNKNKKTYLIHRRVEFRGDKEKVNCIYQQENITTLIPCKLIKIIKKQDDPKIRVFINIRNKEKVIHCDEVLIQHGFQFKAQDLKLAHLKLDNSSQIKKYWTTINYESSINKCYITGPLGINHSVNIILTSIYEVTVAICHMIDNYFERRSKLY